MSIGARLKEERERIGLSQSAVADHAGISKKTQIEHEADRTPPKATYLANIASLGIDVGYVIVGLRAENVAHSPTELAYLRNCRLLATKGFADDGLNGLVFLRMSKGIQPEDMPSVYVQGVGKNAGAAESNVVTQTFNGRVGNVAGRDIHQHGKKDE